MYEFILDTARNLLNDEYKWMGTQIVDICVKNVKD